MTTQKITLQRREWDVNYNVLFDCHIDLMHYAKELMEIIEMFCLDAEAIPKGTHNLRTHVEIDE